jgi:predicted transport protein
VALRDTIVEVLAKATELRAAGRGGNEANTKALLIEPMLQALGWDTADLSQVEREHRVYDNTALDYALKIDGKSRLFIEAKGVAKDLGDRSFIAQAVNYANNEGVLWCVLTNGLSYRVYKTNEPVGMEQKLLFEVDLEEASGDGATEVAQSLELLGRQALIDGDLDLWGERVFTDVRIRHALADLVADPPREFLSAVHDAVGAPEVSAEALKESLARVLDVGSNAAPGSPTSGKRSGKTSKGAVKNKFASKGKEYDLAHHLGNLPAGITDRFEQVDEFIRGLGPDVSRRIRKQYIGYFGGKGKPRSFCTVETQRRRVLIYLGLDPTATVPWNESAMRDVREVGHFGMGDVEYSIRPDADLNEVKDLIRRAYSDL